MIKAILGAVLAALMGALLGCGGGTSGTGPHMAATEVRGVVTNDEGTPLTGTEVTVLESGESVATDQNGEFSLDAPAESEVINIEISNNGNASTVSVVNIPENATSVDVSIEVDPRTNIAVGQGVQIEVSPDDTNLKSKVTPDEYEMAPSFIDNSLDRAGRLGSKEVYIAHVKK